MSQHPELSIVIPLYNEESVLKECYARLVFVAEKIGVPFELVFVDDGSVDSTSDLLKEIAKNDARVKPYYFSRNFGHQIAVKAGIDHAHGDAVVIIDADLQDPPEMIREFWEKWKEGYDVVYAVRVERKGETFLKKATAALFYRFLNSVSSVRIPENVGDYRLISRRVADIIRQTHDRNPYHRGFIAWAGFNQIGIPMHRNPRFAGKTKYSLRKLFGLAWSGIARFSLFPVQAAVALGSFMALGGVVAVIVFFVAGLWLRIDVSATSWVGAWIFLVGGTQIMFVGIIGHYLVHRTESTGSFPIYILKKDAIS